MTPKEALDQRITPDFTKRWPQPILEAVLAAMEDYHRVKVKSVGLGDVGGSFCVICNEVCKPSPTTDGWSHLEFGKGVHFDCAQKIAISRPKE